VNADVSKDGNSIAITARHDLVVQPAEIIMRLRSSDGRRLTSARVNGAPAEILKGDTIQLPSGLRGESKVVGYFG
jgi:hypothetical protein